MDKWPNGPWWTSSRRVKLNNKGNFLAQKLNKFVIYILIWLRFLISLIFNTRFYFFQGRMKSFSYINFMDLHLMRFIQRKLACVWDMNTDYSLICPPWFRIIVEDISMMDLATNSKSKTTKSDKVRFREALLKQKVQSLPITCSILYLLYINFWWSSTQGNEEACAWIPTFI